MVHTTRDERSYADSPHSSIDRNERLRCLIAAPDKFASFPAGYRSIKEMDQREYEVADTETNVQGPFFWGLQNTNVIPAG